MRDAPWFYLIFKQKKITMLHCPLLVIEITILFITGVQFLI